MTNENKESDDGVNDSMIDNTSDEIYFVLGAAKANLTDEMRKLGGNFNDAKMEWFFTDPWKAHEARLLINKAQDK
jgi:hypothetical protein